MTEANSATSPLAVGGHDIFGNKSDRRRVANQLVLSGVGFRGDQGQHGRAVGRCDADPALSGLKTHIEGQTESKLIQVEPQASVLITNEDVDGVDAEVGVVAIMVPGIVVLGIMALTIMGQRRLIRPTERWGAWHGEYYKTTNIVIVRGRARRRARGLSNEAHGVAAFQASLQDANHFAS